MPASLYKDSTITGGYSGRMAQVFRWLTGETHGELGTAGPGGSGGSIASTIRIVEAWDSSYNLRSVSSDGTMDGLNENSRWRDPSLGEIVNGWIVIEFDGTGVNGNTGFQLFWQFTGISQQYSTNVVITRKDWVTDDGGTSGFLNGATAVGGQTVSGLITEPWSIADTWTTTEAIFYAWADNGMFMFCHDDTTNDRRHWVTYAGEVDQPQPGDQYPFIASRQFSPNWGFCGASGSGTNAMYSRVSPVDETTLLKFAAPMTFNITIEHDAWITGGALGDFGGYFRSPVYVAFTEVSHQHIAGRLRYVQTSHRDLGARFTTENKTRIGWSVPDPWSASVAGSWMMDWDGTTAHP